jgi:hypothetical protein
MTLRRYLDRFDQQQLDKQTAVIVHFTGQVDEAALAEAYEALARAHPVLRGCIRAADDGYLLDVSPQGRLHFVVAEDVGVEFLHETVQTWDLREKVAQLTLLRRASGGLLAMHTDHSIADGEVKLTLLRQLLQHYTDIINGIPVSVDAGLRLPTGAEEILAAWRPGNFEPGKGTGTLAYESFPFGQRYLRFSRSQTADLLEAARIGGTSMHAIICGAALTAQRTHVDTSSAAQPMICRTPVNLRARLADVIGSTTVTNLSGLHIAHVEVARDSNPLVIGREVKAQLDAGIAAGTPVQDILDRYPGKPEAFSDPTLSVANISNLGVIPLFPQPASMTITDFQILTQKSGYSHPGYVAYTYGGRVTVQLVYNTEVYTSTQIDALAGTFAARLAQIAVPGRDSQLIGGTAP